MAAIADENSDESVRFKFVDWYNLERDCMELSPSSSSSSSSSILPRAFAFAFALGVGESEE